MGTLYRRQDSPKWYGEYTGPEGRRVKKSTGTTIKRDAAIILAKWESEANDQRHGVTASSNTTLESLLVEYLKFRGGTSVKHRETTEFRIRRVIESLGIVYPRQLDRVAIENIIRTFQTPSEKPISLRSQAHYITAMKSFTRWLVNLRRALPHDIMVGSKPPNFQRDRKKKRRFLTHDEWAYLRQTSHSLLYETAIQTGLRSSELRVLRAVHVRENAIELDARHTKSGRNAKQYISQKLASRLRKSLPFEMPSHSRVADMFRADLLAAKQLWLATKPKEIPPDFLEPYSTTGDLDFHSLRHTCGAWLAIAGVSPKVIQAIMRHSTITLTLDTYGHLMPGAEQEAADQLGVLLGQAKRPAATRQRPGK